MYAQLFDRFLNPAYEKYIKKRETYKHLNELLLSQNKALEENEQRQNESLKNILIHAANQCNYYADFLDVGKINSFTDLEMKEYFVRLPFLTKDIINNNREKMLAKNMKGKLWRKSTGGSTGKPLHFYYTKDSYNWRLACTQRGYGWAGCHPGVKQAYIWGVDSGGIGKLRNWKEALHHFIKREKYFNCFVFTEEVMAQTLNQLEMFKPKILVGYTNPLYNFAKYIKETGKKVIFQLQSVITAAEALHDYQRKLIEEVFRCKIFHTYGSREFMLIGAECNRHSGLHVSMENILLEIVKNDGNTALPGEIGEIVITDLHNWGMPFIRYKIGDMGILSDEACPCGKGLPLLKKVVGRSLDILKTQDGRYVPGEFFPHFFKDFKAIEQFQVVQNDKKNLEIKLVLRQGEKLSDKNMTKIKTEVHKIMGNEVHIKYHFLDDIPLTATGKRRVTISTV